MSYGPFQPKPSQDSVIPAFQLLLLLPAETVAQWLDTTEAFYWIRETSHTLPPPTLLFQQPTTEGRGLLHDPLQKTLPFLFHWNKHQRNFFACCIPSTAKRQSNILNNSSGSCRQRHHSSPRNAPDTHPSSHGQEGRTRLQTTP